MESNSRPKADVTSQPVICEVCGSYFETRRGLSSHARQHLRQLGVTVPENSGAPIDLLYQIIRERDGSLPNGKTASSRPVLTPPKKTDSQEPRDLPVLRDNKTTPHKSSSQASFSESKISEGRNSTSASLQQPTAKPLWAPQDTDAPLTLASTSKDEAHVCQVCGAWYETRKGLSSHARAHLRQIGFSETADSKISPIEFLYKVMESEDFKPVGNEPQDIHTSPKSSTKRPSGLSPLSSSLQSSKPSKRAKASDEFACVLCGETFENRKGLASHSRFHLRQFGVADLLGKASAIDTLQELVNSGMLSSMQPHTEGSPASTASAAAPPRSPLSYPSPSPTPAGSSSSLSPLASASRAPKAKKGFRLAVDPLKRKPKPEPTEIEMSSPPQGLNSGGSSPSQRSDTNIESIPIIPCEYCGQLFDTRKALSCHARAHLRQLGISWSINTSPIDLLQEVMTQGAKVKRETVASRGSSTGGPTWAPKRLMDNVLTGDPATESYTPPLDFSLKSSPGKTSQADTSCELCGFDFDNRKALASHARAHLRQLGVTEWKADGIKGSPIEFLSEWIRKEPAKVADIMQRYRMGDLYIKKSHRTAPSPSLSTDSDSVSGSRVKPSGLGPGHRASRESIGVTGASFKASREQLQSHSDFGVRSPKGYHHPKHSSVPTEEEDQDTNSQQASRSGNIPALLPKPPLTPLVKFVGKVYSLKCRFCEEVFHGPLSIQEDWIIHLQKHILTLGYKGKASPVPTAVATSALIDPVAV